MFLFCICTGICNNKEDWIQQVVVTLLLLPTTMQANIVSFWKIAFVYTGLRIHHIEFLVPPCVEMEENSKKQWLVALHCGEMNGAPTPCKSTTVKLFIYLCATMYLCKGLLCWIFVSYSEFAINLATNFQNWYYSDEDIVVSVSNPTIAASRGRTQEYCVKVSNAVRPERQKGALVHPLGRLMDSWQDTEAIKQFANVSSKRQCFDWNTYAWTL